MPNTEVKETSGLETAVPCLHIAVAVIQDSEQRILLSQRRQGTAGAGLWEYPGGKREAGESIDQALERELLEELGIRPVKSRPLIRIRHRYPDRHVLLDTWLVEAWEGEPEGLEGQVLAWVEKAELAQWDLLPANGPITRAIQLPARYLITPDIRDGQDVFLADFARSLNAGLDMVRLRLPSVADNDYETIARHCLDKCRDVGASLLLDRSPEMVREIGVDGLHLTADALKAAADRPAGIHCLAASCHNAEELRQAQALGCDFVVLGSVTATQSHPDISPIGWESTRVLIDEANLPVYAIGGLIEADLIRAQQAGAQGIAAIRGLWKAHD